MTLAVFVSVLELTELSPKIIMNCIDSKSVVLPITCEKREECTAR